jgi:hypothetical protein
MSDWITVTFLIASAVGTIGFARFSTEAAQERKKKTSFALLLISIFLILVFSFFLIGKSGHMFIGMPKSIECFPVGTELEVLCQCGPDENGLYHGICVDTKDEKKEKKAVCFKEKPAQKVRVIKTQRIDSEIRFEPAEEAGETS